jgi:chemotaxis response regulator CheB
MEAFMAQTKQIRNVGSAVLTGTGPDVIRQLNRSLEQRTVAVTFADDEHAAAAERVIHQVVEFLPQLIQERQEETLKR